MEHREVREYLPAYVNGAGLAPAEVAQHLETCDECRAELESYRELATVLRGLADVTLEPPPWLEGVVARAISERAARLAAVRAGRERLTDPRVAVPAGLAVAAGVAGALIIRGRRRQRRRSLRGRVRSALAQA